MNAPTHIQELDPRLKLAVALVLGPCLWKIGIIPATLCAVGLLALIIPLSRHQPLGPKMIRSLMVFVLFWIGIKIVLDGLSGIPMMHILADAGELGIRLSALLLLGLTLSMSTSARSMGLAMAWAIRPLVGKDRAWRMALSLALMIHFLPLTLATLTSVRETFARRCPHYRFWQRATLIPQAIIRILGQKTWNQTLAIAGRGFDRADAWEPEFSWNNRDWLWATFAACAIPLMFFV